MYSTDILISSLAFVNMETKLWYYLNSHHSYLQRLRQEGAIVTTTESIILQMVGDKEHPQFKPVQKLIMQTLPNTFPKLES